MSKSEVNQNNVILVAGAGQNQSFTTHKGDWDTLLVRVGHWLWKWRKQAHKNHQHSEVRVLDKALEDVWEAKRAYRQPIRAKEQAVRQAAGDRLRKGRRKHVETV